VPRRPRHLEDNLMFDDADGRLVSGGCVLRLRRTPHGARLTWKGPRQVAHGVRSREEIELEVGDADAMQAVLRGLGLEPRFRYQKYREAWSHEGLEIVVDETPIGCFLELEGEPEAIHRVAMALGYGRDDYVLDSYVALFVAGGGTGDMVFAEP
jgi:adenylate cyclase, class 2